LIESTSGGEKKMHMAPIVLQQPTAIPQDLSPKRSLHVAVISDGNGRWATSRGLPRSAGHRAGAETARRIIAAAPGLGIHTLTLFALSSATLRDAVADSEAATANGTRLHLRLAIDYSAREAIFHAACRFYKVTKLSADSFGDVLSEVLRGGSTDVDLLIRTGGEQRLSDFLLWECAFAEFVFLSKRWPDFTAADLESAVQEFGRRERTRGALPDAIAG
jgi:undecaprenyl diphosphate synthase